MASAQPQRAFDELPFEVVEAVTAFLELGDICNLRLVSRTIAAKSGRGTLKKYFANKTINWTSTTQLQSFVELTRPQCMGCFLKSLTINDRAPTGSRTFSEEIALLTEALTNLRHNSVYGGLQAVILTVHGQSIVHNGSMVFPESFPNWRSVWQTAFRTFEITSQALADSGVSVQKLDIFGSINRCSLACNIIAPTLERVNLSKTLMNLKHLSLSLSHHMVEEVEEVEDSNDETAEVGLAAGKGYVDDIKRWLERCPQLERLELHWYKLRSHELSEAQIEEQRFFSQIAQLDNHFSKLRNCRLDGIHTDGDSLLAFFRQTIQLASLTMDHVHLKWGIFAPVFDHLTNHLPHLTHLYLDSLSESSIICFDDPGRPYLPSTCDTNGPSHLTRTGADCQRAISYRFFKGRVKGSPDVIRWRRRQALLYGPPVLRPRG